MWKIRKLKKISRYLRNLAKHSFVIKRNNCGKHLCEPKFFWNEKISITTILNTGIFCKKRKLAKKVRLILSADWKSNTEILLAKENHKEWNLTIKSNTASQLGLVIFPRGTEERVSHLENRHSLYEYGHFSKTY